MQQLRILSTIVLLLTTLSLTGCGVDPAEETTDLTSSLFFSRGGLSAEERAGLITVWLNEKLARDVSITLGERWSFRIFLNIQIAEQKHLEAVDRLFDRYDVPEPVDPEIVGLFPDGDISVLYEELVATGISSRQNAMEVGGQVEDLLIAELSNQLSFVDNPDLISVYTHLRTASERHLLSFDRHAEVN